MPDLPRMFPTMHLTAGMRSALAAAPIRFAHAISMLYGEHIRCWRHTHTHTHTPGSNPLVIISRRHTWHKVQSMTVTKRAHVLPMAHSGAIRETIGAKVRICAVKAAGNQICTRNNYAISFRSLSLALHKGNTVLAWCFFTIQPVWAK